MNDKISKFVRKLELHFYAYMVDKRNIFERQAEFLRTYEAEISVTAAAKAAGIERATFYSWYEEDPAFRRLYEQADEQATKTLEDEAHRRAYKGVKKGIYFKGVKVDTVREYSDTLLQVLLKARAPQKYKDRVSTELTGKDGGPIEHKNIPIDL